MEDRGLSYQCGRDVIGSTTSIAQPLTGHTGCVYAVTLGEVEGKPVVGLRRLVSTSCPRHAGDPPAAPGSLALRNAVCERRIFTEAISKVCAPYAQQTKRSGEIIAAVGRALGGRTLGDVTLYEIRRLASVVLRGSLFF